MENCLSYDTSKLCALCKEDYVLSLVDGVSQCNPLPPSAFANCVQVGYNVCLQCRDEMIWDAVAGACASVDPAKLIGKCLYYKLDLDVLTCVACRAGFRLFENKCLSFVKIQECESYKSEVECSLCSQGHKPTSDLAACEPVTEEVTDCQYYDAQGVCIACMEGYYLDTETSNQIEVQVCRKFIDKFCLQPADSTDCSICQSGYYWDEHTVACVVVQPEQKVEGCDLHKRPHDCHLCKSTHYKELEVDTGNTKCVEKPSVLAQRTSAYSYKFGCTDQDATHCLACPPSSCLTTSLDRTSTDKNFCLGLQALLGSGQIADFCQSYTCPDGSFASLNCVTCSNRFYKDPETSKCVPADYPIRNCLYHSGKATCHTCEEGYYRNEAGNQCSKIQPGSHADIPHCVTVVSFMGVDTIDFKCSQCEDGYKLSPDSYTCDEIE